MRQRQGRGQLSGIDKLPPEAMPHLEKVREALIERRLTQGAIRQDLNTNLAALGLGPVSTSAFSRHSLKLLAEHKRREAALRRLTAVGAASGVAVEAMQGGELGAQLTALKSALLAAVAAVDAIQASAENSKAV